MSTPIRNMRIHFYGVQGTSSTFPSSSETDALRELTDYELLKAVFGDLEQHLQEGNRLDCSLSELLGGPLSRKTLLAYRKKFNIPAQRIYGGWTTCMRIETSDGYDIVLDCGSGFRACARDLQAAWGSREERHLHIFGSHSHSDHTEGFDQAAVCFDPRNTIHIYGNYRFLFALDSYLGIFSKFVREDVLGVQTPVNYTIMPATFIGTELRDRMKPAPAEKEKTMGLQMRDMDASIEIGATRITPFEVFHPTPCLAYIIEHGGKKFVFCTDHELRHGTASEDPGQRESEAAEARLTEHSQGADVLYRDGQYLRSDYDGLVSIGSTNPVPRMDWGHSCIEDVQEMARRCGVKHTYIGHHDPDRGWSECNRIDESLARGGDHGEGRIELARAGTVIDL